jgi:hypothetical protein
MAKRHSNFALFVDGRMVDTGTSEEIGRRQNMRPEYVRWLSTPSHTGQGRKYAVKLDDGGEEVPLRYRVNLPRQDEKVWEMHMKGRSVSEISAITGRTRESVKNIITGVWFDQNPKGRREEWIR